ncbi:hypothetical protein K8W59_02515 [Nocardioides rotundus]|uniref:hypothetical protein n=1 Tax=Nocardioides rotundus TaxID=1774216 RepID=UPI001CBB65A0|nr:hypothetical protein [Nocardioides rotundus]UAL30420.1 hypothetical protein K8W59_02515 [Nocardioides rotundus]
MNAEHEAEPRRPEVDQREPELVERSGTPSESADTAKAPEAVQAAKTTRRGPERSTRAAQELRRVRGVEWVRPTDLLARHGAALAGRGIDFEVELARRTRTPITSSVRGLGECARRLPPLSAFGHSSIGQAGPSRPGVGMS